MRIGGSSVRLLRGALALSRPRASPLALRLHASSTLRSLSSAAGNPLLACVRERALPPFERVQVGDLAPAVRAAAADFSRDLSALEADLAARGSAVRWRDVVEPLELQGDPLGRVWGVVGHLMSVRNSPELRAAHDELQPLVIETATRAAQSRTLYEAYAAVRADAEQWEKLSQAQQRVVELALRSATLSGVALEGEAKEEFNALKLRSAELVRWMDQCGEC